MKYTSGPLLFASSALLAVLVLNDSVAPGDAFGVVQSSNTLNCAAFGSVHSGAGKQQCLTQLMAEPIRITMPALSSTMKEGKVVSWLKSEGDAIEAGEAIMVVESDKADMDVEAFEDGFLAKIITEEGETANVGDCVALVASEESEIDEVAASGDGSAAAAPTAEAPAAEAAAPAAGGEYQNSIAKTEIFMPALSSTMSEGKIVSWIKGVGDFVEAGEALMVVESDKADMDVEAFEDGYLAAILIGEGATADVGAPVGILVLNEADIASISANPTSTTTTPIESAAPVEAAATPDCDFSQVDMPALSSTMKEGKIVSWLKAEGDPVSSGEAIMVVESDKADMDVEAFEDGFLAAIITEEGDVGAVGAPVALIASEESDIPALQAYAASLSGAPALVAAAAAPATAQKATAPKAAAALASGDRVVASPLAKKKADQLGVDINTVAGTGPNGRITASDIEAAASGAAPAAKKAAAPAKPAWTPATGVVAATPMARAAAKKAKVDLATISGTGEFGRVTVDDIKMATGEKKQTRAKPAGAAPVAEMPSEFVEFTGMQRAVSNNMEATLATPIFRVSREILMDKFDALYQGLKPKGITVSALLAKAVALAIEKHPIMNSSYQNGGVQYNADINIAMAVAIDGGLITPTLKYANERSIFELGENWKVRILKFAKSDLLCAIVSPQKHLIVSYYRSLLERQRPEL